MNAKQTLNMIRNSAERSAEKIEAMKEGFREVCRQEGVKQVIAYARLDQEFWDMHGAYLMSDRQDIDDFWFFLSPRDVEVYVVEKKTDKAVLLSAWDPDADFALDEELYGGFTGIHPRDRRC